MTTTRRAGGDPGESEVQEHVHRAEGRGFVGVEADPTPNSHYTVDGVTSGKPTPETDAEARKAAREVTHPHG